MSNSRRRHTEPQRMRRLFRCDWPNGDVSFVLADDEDDAIFELDEIASADRRMLTEVDTFQLHLALKRRKRTAATSDGERNWTFVLEGFGELTAEYMDLAAAGARKKALGSPKERRGLPGVSLQTEVATQQKPLAQMSDIEFRNVFDEFERGPNSLLGGMLDDARTGRSGSVIRTSAVVLLLPNGEERPVAAFSEYGDGEGRESAACCLRYCDQLGVLARNERFERLLLETRIPSLTTTRSTDPVAPDSGFGWLQPQGEEDDATLREATDSEMNVWKTLITEARKRPKALLVSIGMLTLPDGTRRSFCENAEFGDNVGRMAVADNIRTSRRVGLLHEGEALTRHMLEIRLQPLQAVLKLDAPREPGKRRGNALS